MASPAVCAGGAATRRGNETGCGKAQKLTMVYRKSLRFSQIHGTQRLAVGLRQCQCRVCGLGWVGLGWVGLGGTQENRGDQTKEFLEENESLFFCNEAGVSAAAVDDDDDDDDADAAVKSEIQSRGGK